MWHKGGSRNLPADSQAPAATYLQPSILKRCGLLTSLWVAALAGGLSVLGTAMGCAWAHSPAEPAVQQKTNEMEEPSLSLAGDTSVRMEHRDDLQ